MTYVKTTLENIIIPCDYINTIDIIIRIDGRDEFTKEFEWKIAGFDNLDSVMCTRLNRWDIDDLIEVIYENGLLDDSEFYTFEEISFNNTKYNLEEA